MEEQLFKSALKEIRKVLSEEQLSMMFDGSYPLRLIIQPAQEIEGQMDLLEAAEIGEPGTSPGAKLILRYLADDVQLEIVGRMTVEDETYRKVRSKFKAACLYFLCYIHRLAMDNEILDRTKYGGDEDGPA